MSKMCVSIATAFTNYYDCNMIYWSTFYKHRFCYDFPGSVAAVDVGADVGADAHRFVTACIFHIANLTNVALANLS